MATIYVSNVASNGYVVGNNSNSGLTKALAKLTVASAYTAASASDTIVLNDGIYTETTYPYISKANLTLTGETVLGATLRNSSGSDTRILRVASGGTGLVVGPIVIDAQAAKNYCVTFDSGTNAVTFHGTKFTGFTTGVSDGSVPKALVVDQDWSVVLAAQSSVTNVWILQPTITGTSCSFTSGSITATGGHSDFYGLRLDPISPGVIDTAVIDRLSIDMTHTSTSSVACIWSVPRASGATISSLRVRNCTLRATSSGTSAQIYGAWSQGVTDQENTGNNVLLTAQNDLQSTIVGIIERSVANFSPTRFYAAGNTVRVVQVVAATLRGTGIQVGDDQDSAPSNPDSITGVLVEHNTLTSLNHGVAYCWITGAVAVGNRVDDHVIGLLAKFTHAGLYTGNIISRPNTALGTGSLRSKGGVNDIFANNLILVDATHKGMALDADFAGSGTVYKNNIVTSTDGTQLTNLVFVNADSTATFANDDYYSTGGIGATAFRYGAPVYATLAEWIAAQEASALGVDPLFLDANHADYRLSAASTLRTAGVAVIDARDYRGHQFAAPPPVGAFSLWSGDLGAPRTLASGRVVSTARTLATTRQLRS